MSGSRPPPPAEVSMPIATAGQKAAAAQQVLAGMVDPTVRVSVQVDRVLADDHRSTAAGLAAALVCVEMVGPVAGLELVRRHILVSGEARAWCNDEILSAARRAADGIMRKHPRWRRRVAAGAAQGYEQPG
jgi:hypothetical protein